MLAMFQLHTKLQALGSPPPAQGQADLPSQATRELGQTPASQWTELQRPAMQFSQNLSTSPLSLCQDYYMLWFSCYCSED